MIDKRGLFLLLFTLLMVGFTTLYLSVFSEIPELSDKSDYFLLLVIFFLILAPSFVLGKIMVNPVTNGLKKLCKSDFILESLEWYPATLANDFKTLSVRGMTLKTTNLANADSYMQMIDWGEESMAYFFVAYSQKNDAYALFGAQKNLFKKQNNLLLNVPEIYYKRAWKLFKAYEKKSLT